MLFLSFLILFFQNAGNFELGAGCFNFSRILRAFWTYTYFITLFYTTINNVKCLIIYIYIYILSSKNNILSKKMFFLLLFCYICDMYKSWSKELYQTCCHGQYLLLNLSKVSLFFLSFFHFWYCFLCVLSLQLFLLLSFVCITCLFWLSWNIIGLCPLKLKKRKKKVDLRPIWCFFFYFMWTNKSVHLFHIYYWKDK